MIRYTSVVLFSHDVPRLRDFYCDLFGLAVTLDLGGLVTFGCGLSIWDLGRAREMVYGGLEPSPVELQNVCFGSRTSLPKNLCCPLLMYIHYAIIVLYIFTLAIIVTCRIGCL
jgi:hypothetical protein